MEARQSEAVRAALEFEQRGHDYYKDIAAHAENPLTSAVFAALAAEELQHMQRIRRLAGETGVGEAPSLPEGSVEDAVRRVFEETEWSGRETWQMDNAAAYDYATQLEREGHALYCKLAEETESPQEREFFVKLQQEEMSHLTALQNVYNYLNHSGDWFASSESSVWNWMNM